MLHKDHKLIMMLHGSVEYCMRRLFTFVNKVLLKPLVPSVRRLLAPIRRLALWDRHTHRTGTVTFTAHACRGLIKYCYYPQMQGTY